MTSPVRIPADVDMPDRVIGPLTARQAAILGTTGLLLYTAWDSTRPFLAPAAFLGITVPVAVTAIIVALGSRDGVPMDRMLLAAIRHRASPRTRVARPDEVHPAPDWLDRRSVPDEAAAGSSRGRAPLRLPVGAVAATLDGTDLGVIDLGADGLAVAAIASTVNFALRTPVEQESLVATFARYLHSLSAPVQVLVRAERLDLDEQIAQLRDSAADLPHPALETAALDHADYLHQLAGQAVLLRRQVLLVMREPVSPSAPVDGLGGPSVLSLIASLRPAGRRAGRAGAPARRAAEARLVRRLAEAADLLAAAGITVTPLDAARTAAALTAACNPDSLLTRTSRRAGDGDVISGPPATGRPVEPDGGYPDDPIDDGWDDEVDDQFGDELGDTELHGRRWRRAPGRAVHR